MPEKSLFDDDGYRSLREAIRRICEDLNRDGFGNAIIINSHTVREGFLAAEQSVKFYDIEATQLSHYQEIAHAAYWINKLKPIRVQNPYNVAESFLGAGLSLSQELMGLKVSEEKVRSDAEFEINEHVAFHVCRDLILACQLGEVETKTKLSRNLFHERLSHVDSRIELMKSDILHSMRYHNYSARAFALKMEALMRVDDI